ncbi:CoA-binding protein|uniref:CoA-binding protein n=1 Tax=Noviherbaspirillum sp. L7-7A TaxID=2850560 RepID=UPI001C2BA841|nr:CoA-binding protein [Noviherbaspirillum sp. L7-7A]MBV0880657.1 CoA-binding protein [Noviherbaspirillum sp. L7-7A]
MSKAFESIPQLLSTARTIAVVGLSSKPERASHEVAHYLQQHGHRIIPVNPTYAGQSILGEHCYATLTQATREHGVIDVVQCFRKPEEIVPVAEEAVAIGARCLWMQLGVVNEAAAQIARKAGMMVVMDRCMKIEHMALASNPAGRP